MRWRRAAPPPRMGETGPPASQSRANAPVDEACRVPGTHGKSSPAESCKRASTPCYLRCTQYAFKKLALKIPMRQWHAERLSHTEIFRLRASLKPEYAATRVHLVPAVRATPGSPRAHRLSTLGTASPSSFATASSEAQSGGDSSILVNFGAPRCHRERAQMIAFVKTKLMQRVIPYVYHFMKIDRKTIGFDGLCQFQL